MANEQLTIQPNDARMTVIGKSWPDQASDSGGGDWDDTYNGTYSGPIPRTDLPTKIAVTTPPWKTRYYQNDIFNDAGMVVTAYREDDTIWTSEKYPDGTIPFWELIHDFVITKFDEYGYVGYGDKIYSVNPPKNMMWTCFFPGRYDRTYNGECNAYFPYGEGKSVLLGGGTEHYNSRAESEIGKHTFYIPSGDYSFVTYFASTQPYYLRAWAQSGSQFSSESYSEFERNVRSREAESFVLANAKTMKMSDKRTIEGKTVYISGWTTGAYSVKPSPTKGGTEELCGSWIEVVAWNALYGNERIIDFPISWARPEDGAILTTSIQITVVGSNNSFV